tara:strand:+ start:742 stop:954 length:213 start_codon:yes stop_codon:yes gene_type:complete
MDRTQSVSINPYTVKDPRWKWFQLGVLSIQRPDFIKRMGRLPQQGSPNFQAFHEGIERESGIAVSYAEVA